MVRLRFSHGIAAALLICVSLSSAGAADQKSTSTSKELEELRQTIEDQSKQIEALTQQIAHLTEVLEAHGISVSASATPSPTPDNSAGVTVVGVAQPTPDTQGTHTVTKGETLTSIAKHYKISVVELEKVNKIENDRTLQIGQILTIPPVSPATPSATPEEKKENQ